jgi:hypothetical protein
MPYLIKGHMRFTEDDFLMHDFEVAVEQHIHKQSQHEILNNLAQEITRLNTMSHDDKAIYETVYDAIYKDTLKQALLNIVALAHTEGYTLTDLLM